MQLTTDDIIDALGGTFKTALLTKRSPQSVSNWRKAGRFPPKTFVDMQSALQARGIAAPDWLWSMSAPPTEQNSALSKI